MKSILDYNFKNKKVVLRVDYNVPLDDECKVTDTTRIDASLPTIKKILDDGGSIILISHLGRPKKGPEEKFSLKHLIPVLKQKINAKKILFRADLNIEKLKKTSEELNSGEVLLLENIRFYPEETSCDSIFSKHLASLGDCYVNDAFGTVHRSHSSTVGIPQFLENKFSGLLLKKELDAIDKILKVPTKPLTIVMGGAKVSDKILLIENLLDGAVDNLIIGGGMAYTFLKALGKNVGNSLVEKDRLDLCVKILEKGEKKGVKILLPSDSVIADKFDASANTQIVSNDNIESNWMGLDIGPESIEHFGQVILNSKSLLWNGPMGVFEMEKFANGTKKIAEKIADATSKGAFSLIGGGDSVAAINQLGFANKVSYISTGGGAMLEYLEGKILPGVKYLTD